MKLPDERHTTSSQTNSFTIFVGGGPSHHETRFTNHGNYASRHFRLMGHYPKVFKLSHLPRIDQRTQLNITELFSTLAHPSVPLIRVVSASFLTAQPLQVSVCLALQIFSDSRWGTRKKFIPCEPSPTITLT